jgi:hypothetical protein
MTVLCHLRLGHRREAQRAQLVGCHADATHVVGYCSGAARIGQRSRVEGPGVGMHGVGARSSEFGALNGRPSAALSGLATRPSRPRGAYAPRYAVPPLRGSACKTVYLSNLMLGAMSCQQLSSVASRIFSLQPPASSLVQLGAMSCQQLSSVASRIFSLQPPVFSLRSPASSLRSSFARVPCRRHLGCLVVTRIVWLSAEYHAWGRGVGMLRKNHAPGPIPLPVSFDASGCLNTPASALCRGSSSAGSRRRWRLVEPELACPIGTSRRHGRSRGRCGR